MTTDSSNSSNDNHNEIHIGSRIRDLRKAKRMTIKRLAELASCSVGYISQIERGISDVPISTLKPIATALEVQISWFFHQPEGSPSEEQAFVVRQHQRSVLNFSGAGIREQMLSPDLKGETLLVMSEIEPDCEDPAEVTRPVEEAGLVMDGQLELTLGNQTLLLETGDSFRIPKNTPHRIRNPGDSLSRTLWIITPPNY